MLRKTYNLMQIESFRPKAHNGTWSKLQRLLEDQPELLAARHDLVELRAQSESEHAASARSELGLKTSLEQARNDRLQWMAKEASTRKELQDCQERSNDLLEQVVRLTHAQRQVRQDLLDHQFKTETTPLERNRYEMEMAEARGRVKRAEEQAKHAEETAANLERRNADLESQLARAKDVESQLAWSRRQLDSLNQALGASVFKVTEFEEQVAKLQALQRAAAAVRRAYHPPAIRPRPGRALPARKGAGSSKRKVSF